MHTTESIEAIYRIMEDNQQTILNANILIADDQLINVKLLEKTLRQAGYKNIFSTTNSYEVVELYTRHDIDLVILDIRMPNLDGFEVMQQLKDVVQDGYLPILVLTAELTTETRHRALSSGAKDFLTKPFEQIEALQRVHNILEVHILHKQVVQQNKELETRVKERTYELEQSRLEIIKRLGLAAEYKDNETGQHILRMSEFSRMLAKAAGLSDFDAETILHAAPMHDIGKIGIPDYVLLKPGKLNAEEWEIMKTHVTIGERILSGSDFPLMIVAKNIALTHHEKWDGTGYPQGLKGKDIPIEGRICALCDVFDALASDRPYKKAWPTEEIMEYIKEQSGRHFDPDLVTLFEGILDQVLEFSKQHQ